jgi:hypothetical protein
MQTPLYKRLKSNGTSIYVFPGSAEDVSAAYQNDNYKMYFSKYMLLNLPAENTNNPGGTQASPTYFDFSTFSTINTTGSIDYKDAIVESLRNYVANHEVSLRESRLNNTEYYYDTTALETTTEKIFWKWCKKLNIIDFEPAVAQDEYFENLTDFERINQNDDSYFPEYLWKEREITDYNIINYYTTSSPTYVNYLELAYSTITNYREGDIINFSEMSGPLTGFTISTTILDITTTGNSQTIIVDYPNTSISSSTASNYGVSTLNYHRLVQYIGEVNGVSNVQEANKAYTQVYANVPDHTGQTPDVLFRTKPDSNYRPNLIFPIIPSQYQPEIIGSELFSSPIVSNPVNYPGSYYGQFDTIDFTYVVEPGDSLRRSGRFYGVTGDINQPSFDGSTIDGVIVDFNTDHYAKMNITDREVTNFDQFNALQINNQPPSDFEFNAVLWYYTVEDMDGNRVSNLYGVSFLNNPDNNPDQTEVGVRFPLYDKFVVNGNQDGSAYSFGLNLNFNIVHDNPVEAYNPEAINSLFSMNLFNETMKRLSSVNDSFLGIVAENNSLKSEIVNIKQLLYSQTDLATINSRINNLDQLLKLYSTQQIVDSDTIGVEVLDNSPSSLRLNNLDRNYYSVNKLLTNDMYDTTGAIPINVTPPKNKNFLINIVNNDEVNLLLPNNDKLTLLMTTDLVYKQSVDIIITGTDTSSENKKLDIYITTVNPIQTSTQSTTQVTTPPVETLLIGDIDLPVFYNVQTTQPNSASTWSDFSFPINFNQNITLLSGDLLELSFNSNPLIVGNSINVGDQLVLNNMFVGTQSVFDFSGQYVVDDVNGSVVRLDISSNDEFISYLNSQVLPFSIHTPTSTNLSNNPYVSLNKGYKITVTRISDEDNVQLSEKYMVDVRNLEY